MVAVEGQGRIGDLSDGELIYRVTHVTSATSAIIPLAPLGSFDVDPHVITISYQPNLKRRRL